MDLSPIENIYWKNPHTDEKRKFYSSTYFLSKCFELPYFVKYQPVKKVITVSVSKKRYKHMISKIFKVFLLKTMIIIQWLEINF